MLEPVGPANSASISPRFGFAEALGLLDPEGGPGGFVVFARETSRCELTYARNNPLKYVDPDGKDFRDFTDGVANAFWSNQIVGPEMRDSSNRDFRLGQAFGDAISVIGGAIQTIGGGTVAVGGGALEALTLGGSTPVSVPMVAGGAAVAIPGAKAALSGLVNLMKSNNSGESGSEREATPSTDKGKFANVRGSDAKVNKKTGEVYVMDKLHKNHYEVYRSKKEWEGSKRVRSVWTDGRLKEKF